MPELTDDQLDGLFRKSAEEFDPPFDPAAWQDMKIRLDTNDRTMPSGAAIWKNLLRWGLPVALLLLLTGGGWYVYRKASVTANSTVSPTVTKPGNSGTELNTTVKGSSTSTPTQLADAKHPVTAPVRSSEGSVNGVQPSADLGKVETFEKASNLKNRVEKPVIESTKTTLPKGSDATKSIGSSYTLKTEPNRSERYRLAPLSSVANNRVVTAKRLNKIVASKQRSSARTQRGISHDSGAFSTTGYALSAASSVRKRSVTNKSEATQPQPAAPVVDANTTATESDQTTSLQLPAYAELSSRPARWPQALGFTSRPVIAQPDTTAHSVVPKADFQRGLSIRFGVAPDLSSVGLKNFSRPGTNVGVFLEYRLASRWSIQAGVIQSTKVYRATGDEYAYLPDEVGKYPANLASIDGRCSMLDIPINLRYDFIVSSQRDKQLPNRWFVSGGITSYIMNQEDYTYNYYKPYPTSRQGESESTGGYKFSNLNLSVGYERAISRRLSWQVEPFMKVPLQRVGFFKVNLLSTGAFFSIRYKL